MVHLKQESVLKQTGKDAVIWSLKQLSTSAILCSKWESSCDTSSMNCNHVSKVQATDN